MTCFYSGDRNLLQISVGVELNLAFVWVIAIDLDLMWDRN